jgi:DNA-binding CsgD family transcriptional regulator
MHSNVNRISSLKLFVKTISHCAGQARETSSGGPSASNVMGRGWSRSQAGAFSLHYPMARDENLKSIVGGLPGLSVREQQITNLACDGLSNKAIAHRLGLSEGTVKIHLHHIYRKLGIGGRHALVSLALSRRGRS